MEAENLNLFLWARPTMKKFIMSIKLYPKVNFSPHSFGLGLFVGEMPCFFPCVCVVQSRFRSVATSFFSYDSFFSQRARSYGTSESWTKHFPGWGKDPAPVGEESSSVKKPIGPATIADRGDGLLWLRVMKFTRRILSPTLAVWV